MKKSRVATYHQHIKLLVWIINELMRGGVEARRTSTKTVDGLAAQKYAMTTMDAASSVKSNVEGSVRMGPSLCACITRRH